MADGFRIFAYDINTNTPLAELPGNGLKFSTRKNEPGSCSFSVPLKSPGVSRRTAPVLAYGGNPVACYIDEGGTIVWGGIIWTGNYTKSEGVLEFGGREWQSWGDQRIAAADYSEATYPAGIDPAQLLYKIYTDAQNTAISGVGASVGLQINSTTTTIPPIIPGYPLDQRTQISSIAADMTDIIAPNLGSIDVSVSSRWDEYGNPVNNLTVWFPRVGRSFEQSQVMFDLSAAMNYSWPTDASQMGNRIRGTGAGNGSAAPTVLIEAPGVPVGGLGQTPRLDKVVSYQSVQSQSQLELMVNGAAKQFGRPLVTPTIKVRAAGNLGAWIVGDDVRVYTAGDERFPDGLDEVWEIVQQEVEVPDEGISTITVTLNAKS